MFERVRLAEVLAGGYFCLGKAREISVSIRQRILQQPIAAPFPRSACVFGHEPRVSKILVLISQIPITENHPQDIAICFCGFSQDRADCGPPQIIADMGESRMRFVQLAVSEDQRCIFALCGWLAPTTTVKGGSSVVWVLPPTPHKLRTSR